MGEHFISYPVSIKECLEREMDTISYDETFNDEIAVYEGRWNELSSIKKIILNGRGLTFVPEELKNLPALETLEIRNGAVKELPLWIGDIANLNLYLYNMTNEYLFSLFGNFDASRFREAKIKNLVFQGDKLTEIPENIGNLINLSEISIHATGIKEIPEWLQNFEKLQDFSLYSSPVNAIPEWFCGYKKLKRLRIDDRGHRLIKALPENLGNLQSLEGLGIHYCDIDKIPDSCWDIATLKKIEFWGLKITELSEDIKRCKQLETLVIQQCPIKKFPDSIGSLKSLKKLQLDDFPDSSIPSSWANLSSLENLSLAFTTESKLTELPGFTGCLASLVSLHIRNGKMVSLPENIGT